MEKIKVLVVDDSALIRRIVSDILEGDPRFAVVGTARDGQDALEKIEKLSPQLITLDVEMPRMGGLEALKEIIRLYRLPVIMLSSLTQRGSAVTVEALAHGAVDFVPKPDMTATDARNNLARELLSKAAAAAGAQIIPLPAARGQPVSQPQTTQAARRVVAVAASTGGPRALESIMTALPGNLAAAVLVTQHMPPVFTKALAERLNKLSALEIKEAENGEPLLNGKVYVAPGNFHLEVDSRHCTRLTQSPPVEYVRPSATVMMRTVAEVYKSHALGVILTGMGKDGKEGIAAIKRQGGVTLAQDEATSVIFSMPKAAIQAGVVDRVLPLGELPGMVIALCRRSADGSGFRL
ncbi:MAG: Chemotaxis response regulator protein-glutamate methylesterase [Syntrophomonadaceae bacterium]|nr:Chemotaxis response regulator protein-glutamate methylesterase [Bacillota bacterium]